MSTPFRVLLWGLNVNPDTWQTFNTKQWMIWCSLLCFFSRHPHNFLSRHTQLYFWEFIHTHTHTNTHPHDTVAFSAEEGANPIDGARWTLCSYWEKGMRKLGRKKQRQAGQARVTRSRQQTVSQDSVWTTEGQDVPHSAHQLSITTRFPGALGPVVRLGSPWDTRSTFCACFYFHSIQQIFILFS